MDKQDYLFKVILLGERGVGKTSLICRYRDGIFNTSYYYMIGVDFVRKEEDIDGTNICLQIWDYVWHERFRLLKLI